MVIFTINKNKIKYLKKFLTYFNIIKSFFVLKTNNYSIKIHNKRKYFIITEDLSTLTFFN